VNTLNRKLIRDLKDSWGQVIAISIVISAGVATFIMSMSTFNALTTTRDAYYRDYRFEEVFASLIRAPEALRERIADIEGVDKLETRVIAAVKVTVENFNEPITGQIISVPDYDMPAVNRLYIREGRYIEPLAEDEVILNEVFADAHDLKTGDHIEVIIKGHLKALRVVGVALSPEFIYQVAPGSVMPDFRRFGVFWMSREVLGKAYEMDNAFNSVVMTLQAGANENDVITKLDHLLERYGGQGAMERYWQPSHRIFKSDIDQLSQMAFLFSAIFLGVGAFLLNILVHRLVNIQREQIAALKAFGYFNLEITLHFLAFVSVIVLIGFAVGAIAGVKLGEGLSQFYFEFYRLPIFIYELDYRNLLLAALITLIAAYSGTLLALRKAIALAPAQAMQPEPPARFRKSFIERLGFSRFMSQGARMIIRNIGRKPFKSALSVTGIAFACGIMIVGTFFKDAIDFMIDIEYGLAQRQDLTVNFTEPTSYAAYYELLRVEGVQYGESFRHVPVRLRNTYLDYLTSVSGYERNTQLHRILDMNHHPVNMPEDGLLLTEYLGNYLGVKEGDQLLVEVLEGRRPKKLIQVSGLTAQYLGVGAYMHLDALNRLMDEGRAISGTFLDINPIHEQAILNKMHESPRVANVEVTKNTIQSFYDTSAEFIFVFVSFMSILAGIITFGVVYNTVRITFSERSGELASLRVLGFTRGEVSFLLLGELALLTLIAVPSGFFIGHLLSWHMIQHIPQEIFRVPLIIEPSTYALSATVVIIAAILSGFLVRTKIDHLDMVAALKIKV